MNKVNFISVDSESTFDKMEKNPFNFYIVPRSSDIPLNGIYGIEWNGSSSPIWTRTDDAVNIEQPQASFDGSVGYSAFDDIYPWSEMKIVEDDVAGTLVSIPKFYYKLTMNGVSMKLQISGTEFDGSHISPAHMDRGDGIGERDVVYVGRYISNVGNKKSASGQTACELDPWDTARSSIHSLGKDIWLWDYPMYWTICMLFLVEYATWNSRGVLGTPNSSRTIATGGTSSMPYHTGNSGIGSALGLVQYRHIENPWGAWAQFIDGLYTYNQQIYVAHNPYNPNYVSIGNKPNTPNRTQGIITSFVQPQVSGYEYALIPYTFSTSASDNEYVCDNVVYNNSTCILRIGSEGLFNLDFTASSTARSANFGARLMKL